MSPFGYTPFGNAPRDLTIQGHGNTTAESGCNAPTPNNPSTPMFGSTACTPDSFVSLSNGMTNIGGHEPNPQALNQKFDLPTFGSLGITSASDVAILFNATEPVANSAFVNDLTLTVYSPTGVWLFAIDGSQDFRDTIAGFGLQGSCSPSTWRSRRCWRRTSSRATSWALVLPSRARSPVPRASRS